MKKIISMMSLILFLSTTCISASAAPLQEEYKEPETKGATLYLELGGICQSWYGGPVYRQDFGYITMSGTMTSGKAYWNVDSSTHYLYFYNYVDSNYNTYLGYNYPVTYSSYWSGAACPAPSRN